MSISKETVKLVLYNCLGFKKSETVAVVTDEGLWELGEGFYQGAKKLGIETVLVAMKARAINGEEPPPAIAEALRQVDIALLITTKSLSHTNARRQACASPRRVRVVSMPGADARRLDRLLNVNYDRMHADCLALANALKKTRRVEITTASGTHVTMDIQGRVPHIDSGILTQPGAFGNLPAGEVYLAPLEGTANGILVIDGSMAGIGRLTKPIRITIKNGVAVKTDSPELNKIINPFSALGGRNIAELGIGTNPNAEVVGNILEDEKAINTVHIALGDNLSMGGKVKAPCHLDGIICAPRIKLDGKPLALPAVRRNSPARTGKTKVTATGYSLRDFEAVRSTVGPVLYQMLFADSNDPQYVLDLKSQVFLEVNEAFLALCGYRRSEVVGRLKASDLTPPGYHPVLQKKIAERKGGSERDRYEFQMLAKSGEIKPLEISVRKITLGGHEVILGSVRDISERLKMEKALREKITEITLAGNRLMVLTEKIKNVPLLTTKLLQSQTEDTLYRQAIRLLCEQIGLKCRGAAIYLITDSRLTLGRHLVPTAAGRRLPRTVDLTGRHRFAKIIRGEVTPRYSHSELLLPLKGLKQQVGLIRILLDPVEQKLMETNITALKGYQDVLETIASILGLLIESMRLNKTLEVQSNIDGLTQIYNRRYFDRMLQEETARARRYRRPLSLFILDLDNFKEINDTAGHKQGDVTLTELARLLRRQSRNVDIICRYGGDEFAIILPETTLAGAVKKARLLSEKIKAHRFRNVRIRRKPYSLMASIGVSALSEEKGIISEETLLSTADRALYQAKDLKGDHVKSI